MKKNNFKYLFYLSYFLVPSLSYASHINQEVFDSGINKCMDEVQKYFDFECDFLEFSTKNIPQDMDYQYNTQDIVTHLNKIIKYKNKIFDIYLGKESLDSVLSNFLNERLFYLKCREEEGKYNYFPIDNQERLKNKIDAEVTFFQFSNYMIALLYQLTSPQDLSVKTRKQIRLSPSLWPLLRKETDELGHPDKAGDDLAAFNTYVDPSHRTSITYLNWGQKKQIHRLTPYARSCCDESWDQY